MFQVSSSGGTCGSGANDRFSKCVRVITPHSHRSPFYILAHESSAAVFQVKSLDNGWEVVRTEQLITSYQVFKEKSVKKRAEYPVELRIPLRGGKQ
jgi:hypothetical protein